MFFPSPVSYLFRDYLIIIIVAQVLKRNAPLLQEPLGLNLRQSYTQWPR